MARTVEKEDRETSSAAKIFSDDTSKVPFLLFTSLAMIGAVLVVQLFLTIFTFQVASRKAPTLVELGDGQTIRTIVTSASSRSDETIHRFVIEEMTQLMTWRGTLPTLTLEDAQSPPRPDPGVSIAQGKKVATGTSQAAWGLAESFRTEFLTLVSALTPQEIFTSDSGATAALSPFMGAPKPANQQAGQGTQVVLIVKYLSAPQVLSDGKWKLKMVANLIYVRPSDGIGKVIAFNKEIYVQAVEPPTLQGSETPTELAIARVRKSGLEIYAMRDLLREDIKQ
jgi:hypothetical protein